MPVNPNTPPEPRSLTPITERTDIASRNPSQRTEKSQFFTSDSPGQHRQVTKQPSGGSSKHANSLGGDERLATITDSNENGIPNGQVTDEPAALDTTAPSQPVRSDTGDSSIVQPTPTTHESATTDWSQETGATPGPGSMTPAREETEEHDVLDTPQPPATMRMPSTDDRDLPDLPGGYKATQEQSAVLDNQDQQQSAAGRTPSDATFGTGTSSALRAVPPLAAALPSPTGSRDTAVLSPTPRRGSADRNPSSGYEQAAAAYLANVVESRSQPSNISPPAGHTPLDMGSDRKVSDEKPRPTIITQLDTGNRSSLQNDLGRKPSGARPLPVKTDSARNLKSTPEEREVPLNQDKEQLLQTGTRSDRLASATSIPDLGEDAANFMAYADQMSPVKSTAPLKPAVPAPVASSQTQKEDEMRSSFAPSQAATERKAKAEQAVADQQKAKTMPGAGRRTARQDGQTWSDESDEEDKDEESEDEDARVKTAAPISGLPPTGTRSETQSATAAPRQPVQRVLSQTRALPAIPRSGLNGDGSASSGSLPNSASRREFAPVTEDSGYAPLSAAALVAQDQRDAPRSRSPAAPLPQPPTVYPQQPQQQQQIYAQQQQQQHSYPQQQQQQQQQPPPATRQTIWNANFSADHGLDPSSKSGKFVDIDEPAHLTKAFAPHGLLQAGMQDKEDRSAKRQEEFAREMGSSLVHVPEKPPPPQTGLLGAVAQHERERQGAGGIGAAITDRDRDRRQAVSDSSTYNHVSNVC